MTQDEKIYAIVRILEQSDIIWTRYGMEIMEELAKRILLKLEEPSDD